MPFNGSGIYNPPSPEFPAVAGNIIYAAEYNTIINDIATALSKALLIDGQNQMAADLALNAFNVVDSADAVDDGDLTPLSQVLSLIQDRLRGIVSVKDFDAVGDGTEDDTDAIQDAIDSLAATGGIVYIPAGIYSVTGITLVPGVAIFGDGPAVSIIKQVGAIGIDQATDSYLDGVVVSDIGIDYAHASPAQSHVGLRVRSMQGCTFKDIKFTGFSTSTGAASNDGQIAIQLYPTNITALKKNCILNTFSNIYIEDARIGVYYKGTTDTGTFNQTSIQTTTATAANVITGNRWFGITMRSITDTGIYAEQWVDSEKWYAPYIRVIEDDAICINLGTDADYFTQVDRFYIQSPNLESNAPNKSTTTALRMGVGAFRHEVLGIISDDDWDSGAGNNFFDVADAQSYRISFSHQGDGVNYGCGDLMKGSSTKVAGTATIPAGDTSITVSYTPTVTNKLHRTPTSGEIMITPRSNLSGTSYWLGAMGASSFIIHIAAVKGSDMVFNYSIDLLEV